MTLEHKIFIPVAIVVVILSAFFCHKVVYPDKTPTPGLAKHQIFIMDVGGHSYIVTDTGGIVHNEACSNHIK
jgi:hypothetical protein